MGKTKQRYYFGALSDYGEDFMRTANQGYTYTLLCCEENTWHLVKRLLAN